MIVVQNPEKSFKQLGIFQVLSCIMIPDTSTLFHIPFCGLFHFFFRGLSFIWPGFGVYRLCSFRLLICCLLCLLLLRQALEQIRDLVYFLVCGFRVCGRTGGYGNLNGIRRLKD